MHELAVSRRLVETIEEQAIVHGYASVKTVRLAIGPFTCIEPAALRTSFQIAAGKSCAAGALIDIRAAPADGHCPACGASEAVEDYFATCPACGAVLDITGGSDLKIVELEVS